MDASVLKSSQWELILTLLSLDGVVPFYEAMGLQLPEKQRFLQMLRRLIVERRKICEDNSAFGSLLSARLLQETETLFNKPTAEHFYKWTTTVFYSTHSDQPHWSAWDIILPYHPDQRPNQVSLPAEKYDAIARFREGKRTDDIDQQVTILRSQPLTNWDSEVYSLYHFSNKDDPMCEDDFIDPYSFILNTVEMNRFQLGWGNLIAQFSADDRIRLWEYGKQLLADEEIEMPETLRHMGDMHRQV